MIRALYTAASGMTTQQNNVDVISNNIANVNTVGYKKESASFKSLLYQNLEVPKSPESSSRPESLQVGHGVKLGSITRDFSTGSLQETGNSLDLAIQGDGFFAVQKGDETMYTKDGSFKASIIDDSSYALVSSSGEPLISVDNEPIIIDSLINAKELTISSDGKITYLDDESDIPIEVAQIQLVQFSNVEGLDAAGGNLFKKTSASGEPILELDSDLTKSEIKTGYLETSNVDVAQEMVNLIMAQRAYEMNSTAIKTADTMMQQANELKRV